MHLNGNNAIKSAIIRVTIDDLNYPFFEIDMMDSSVAMASIAFDEVNEWLDRLNVIIHRNATAINPSS